jgi:hypothetical protein
LITLAPKSASIIVQNGPAIALERSKTVMPCRGARPVDNSSLESWLLLNLTFRS